MLFKTQDRKIKASGKGLARQNFNIFEPLEGRQLYAAHILGDPTVYSTIQSAVDAAAAGATINVDAGTYNETVVITQPMTIQGAQAGVDARNTRGAESIVFATQTVFDVRANDVTIDGFTIEGNDADIGALQGAGVLMRPSIHGTHVFNNIIQNNVTGIYLSNNSDTDACLIQHNLIQNNFEANNNWQTKQENGSRGIYTDGTVSGGFLTNVLIDSNTIANFNFKGGDEDEGIIALQALTAGKQFNITISNNTLAWESKALLATNVTNLSFIGNTVTNFNDGSSGPVRFEGNANTVNIQYNSIHNNAGPGVAADSSGVSGDSSGFVVNNNDIYSNNGIGLLTIANAYDGPVTAIGDWWGDATGPGGDGPGKGQAVWANGVSGHGVAPKGSAGGTISFTPWATALIDITKIPAPAAPQNLQASIASSSQINLTWTPQMTTALNQFIQRSTDGVNFTTIATVSPLINSYSDSSLSTLGYSYRVIAANQTGNSAPSNVASTIPTPPSSLLATAVSQTKINLSWADTAPGLETGFIIQRSSDGVNFSQIGTVGAGIVNYVDNTVTAGQTYAYRIVAMGSVGNSGPSATVTATALAANSVSTPLSSLNWVSASAGYGSVQKNASIVGNPITLRGTTYSTGIGTHAASTIVYNLGGAYTNFLSDVGIDDEEIGKGTGSVDFQVVGDGKVLFDSGILTNASPVVSINVSVVGVQTLTLIVNNGIPNNIDYDHADWAGAQLLSAPKAPVAPVLTATALSSSSIKLTWTAAGGDLTGFTLERSADGGTTWSLLGTLASNVFSYTDSNLTAGQAYSYRIRSTNSVGDSPNSTVATATTLTNNSVVTNLSSLTWTSATTGYGTIQKNLSIGGNPITLRGTTYTTGIGTHAASTITYNLNGAYTNFLSDVGIDDEEVGKGTGSVDFQVIGDGKVLFDSGVLTNASPVVSINVSVAGVNTLQLVANNGIPNDIDFDHSDWAGARLLSNPSTPTAPTSVSAIALSTKSIKFTWTPAGTNQTGFAIDRSLDGTNFTPLTTVGASIFAYTDMNLTPGVTYYYRVRATNAQGASVNSPVVMATTLAANSVVTNLSSLNWTSATTGYGTIQKDESISGNTLTLRGNTYSTGIGTHAASQISYNLGGAYKNFITDIGVDDEVNGHTGSVDFQVLGDGKVLFDSGILTNASSVMSININVTGVQTLTLIATNGVADSIDYDHADWAGARLIS